MKVVLKQVEGITLAGLSDSGHWVMVDGPESLGGSAAGPRPMELILLGLGGCTSMDVISILQKKRVALNGYECHIEAECATEHPKVYTHITLKFIFYGEDIPPAAVERAIELSETKYCSVTAMLSKTAEIRSEYEIRKNKPTPE